MNLVVHWLFNVEANPPSPNPFPPEDGRERGPEIATAR
jgi:hypothetical protein